MLTRNGKSVATLTPSAEAWESEAPGETKTELPPKKSDMIEVDDGNSNAAQMTRHGQIVGQYQDAACGQANPGIRHTKSRKHLFLDDCLCVWHPFNGGQSEVPQRTQCDIASWLGKLKQEVAHLRQDMGCRKSVGESLYSRGQKVKVFGDVLIGSLERRDLIPVPHADSKQRQQVRVDQDASLAIPVQ